MTKVKIALGLLATEALKRNSGTGGDAEMASEEVMRAIRLYLRDKGGGGPTWTYPKFLVGEPPAERAVELELSLDERLWRDFEAEAARQSVVAERLLEHAIFYYAAELDAGRVTTRIAVELDEEED